METDAPVFAGPGGLLAPWLDLSSLDATVQVVSFAGLATWT